MITSEDGERGRGPLHKDPISQEPHELSTETQFTRPCKAFNKDDCGSATPSHQGNRIEEEGDADADARTIAEQQVNVVYPP